VTRKWKAAASMTMTAVFAGAVAIAIFGWADMSFYLTQILPRTLESGSVYPYNPANPAFATFFRRLFVFEAELNPHPFANAPWLFYFLQPFVSLGILTFTTLAVALKRTNVRPRDFALYMFALILISTSVASYTYVLLLLPIIISLEDAGLLEGIYLITTYLLVNAPLRAGALFPKVWLLLALLVVSGWSYWRLMSRRLEATTVVMLVLVACWNAQLKMASYRREPAQHFERIVMRRGTMFSAFPAILRAGIFFQTMSRDRYVLGWRTDDRVEEFSFDGDVFHPSPPNPRGPVRFEVVAHGISTMMEFDPITRSVTASPISLRSNGSDSVTSPDGHWLAFTSTGDGPEQIYVRALPSGQIQKLTSGNCNSWGPAWELDGKAVVFASDCGRAIGLPALYRAQISEMTQQTQGRRRPDVLPHTKKVTSAKAKFRKDLLNTCSD
jgi:hypothetical protein